MSVLEYAQRHFLFVGTSGYNDCQSDVPSGSFLAMWDEELREFVRARCQSIGRVIRSFALHSVSAPPLLVVAGWHGTDAFLFDVHHASFGLEPLISWQLPMPMQSLTFTESFGSDSPSILAISSHLRQGGKSKVSLTETAKLHFPRAEPFLYAFHCDYSRPLVDSRMVLANRPCFDSSLVRINEIRVGASEKSATFIEIAGQAGSDLFAATLLVVRADGRVEPITGFSDQHLDSAGFHTHWTSVHVDHSDALALVCHYDHRFPQWSIPSSCEFDSAPWSHVLDIVQLGATLGTHACRLGVAPLAIPHEMPHAIDDFAVESEHTFVDEFYDNSGAANEPRSGFHESLHVFR